MAGRPFLYVVVLEVQQQQQHLMGTSVQPATECMGSWLQPRNSSQESTACPMPNLDGSLPWAVPDLPYPCAT